MHLGPSPHVLESTATDVGAPPTIRVLMVTARFLPHLGGTEIHTYELARRLAARGVDVTVLTTEVDADRVRTDSDYGFRVIRVRAWPRNRDWYFAPGLQRIIRSGRWDLVHVQGVHTLVLPIALATTRRVRRPYVITLHSGGHSSGVRQWSRRLVWGAFGRGIRAADRIIAVSEFERRTFASVLAIPDASLTVIPSGVELPEPSDGQRLEQGDGANEERPLIVSLGRLERYKGHDRIVRALPVVASRFPGVRLVILGTGPDEERLRRLAADVGVADRLTILAIPADRRAELHALLRRADLAVALSAYESQGLAAMEAAALGCSVLVADSSALHELVTAGVARGVGAVPTEDLAAAVVDQLREPHRGASALPTWDECARKTHQLYLAVLGS